jgi:type IX secretion system PorP/SprF family membrane protein
MLNFGVKAQNCNMFWNAKSWFNPASMGLNHKYYTALIGKKQWLGKNDAPIRIIGVTDMKINALHSGIGINYMFDKSESFKFHYVDVGYCYHINFKSERILSIGISGGVGLEKIDFITIDDEILSESNDKFTFYNFKFGLFYISNHLELGLSSTHQKMPEEFLSDSKFLSNYWVYSSYQFDLDRNIDLKPNIILRAYEFNTKNIILSSGFVIIFNEKIWTGITYTTENNFGAMFGLDIKKMIRIGYAFSTSSPKYNEHSNGNHELVLAFKL